MLKFLIVLATVLCTNSVCYAGIADRLEILSPCTGTVVNTKELSREGKMALICEGEIGDIFYYDVERSKNTIYAAMDISPDFGETQFVFTPCSGVIYSTGSKKDGFKDVIVRCGNNNLIVAIYYLDELTRDYLPNDPVKFGDVIGKSGMHKWIAVEIFDITTREYLNPEQIFMPGKFGIKPPAGRIISPLISTDITVYN